MSAALERYQSWLKDESFDTLLPGTGLLSGYNIILLGEYDQPASSNQRTAKRKKKDDSVMKKTRGGLNILMLLAGARVYDVQNVTNMKQLKSGLTSNQCDIINELLPSGLESPTLKDLIDESTCSTRLIVIVKDNASIKFGEEFLSRYFTAAAIDPMAMDHISIVTSDWLLDCIGEFEVKKAT